MFTVDVDDLIRYCRRLDGRVLRTLWQKKEFSVHVTEQSLEYTPLISGITRKHNRKWLKRVCDEFSRTNSFHPGDYLHISANASYALTVIDHYINRRSLSNT
jgi:hypothetical protein